METSLVEYFTLAIGAMVALGGLIGYLINQNTKIAALETKIAVSDVEIKELKELVGKNAEAVQNLAVLISGMSEKMILLIDLKRV